MRIDRDAHISVYSNGTPDRKMKTPNYAVFDRTGNLYVSDSGGWHENDGCLFFVSPDGQTRIISAQTTAFPNGMALSPDGSYLYVVLSNLPGIVKLPVEKDGAVGLPQPVVELPGSVPDGLAFDQEFSLYISCYTPDLIYQLSANGELAVLVEDRERTAMVSPTNIAFADAELSTLVTSNLCGWHLNKIKMQVPGAPLHYPIIP
jgi:gluconolactonase